MTKLFILLLFASAALISCDDKQPLSEEKKGDFDLQFLFEKDGCKMYRFYDGRWIYWADCRGKVNSDYKTTSRAGKTTTTVNHYVEAITSE